MSYIHLFDNETLRFAIKDTRKRMRNDSEGFYFNWYSELVQERERRRSNPIYAFKQFIKRKVSELRK